MTKKNTVTQEDIETLLQEAEILTQTIGGKTTIVCVTLKNGFVLTESSSCVDPANYDEAIGAEIALGHIADRLWMLEGYRLQQAVYEASHAE